MLKQDNYLNQEKNNNFENSMASLEKRISHKDGDIFKLILQSTRNCIVMKPAHPTYLINKISEAGEEDFQIPRTETKYWAEKAIMDHITSKELPFHTTKHVLNAYIHGTIDAMYYILFMEDKNNMCEKGNSIHDKTDFLEEYDLMKEKNFEPIFLHELGF